MVRWVCRDSQTIIAKKGMDELAARYEFNFIGASTTRRLAESFASIYTGIAPSHVVYHKPQAYSSGNLKVGIQAGPFQTLGSHCLTFIFGILL